MTSGVDSKSHGYNFLIKLANSCEKEQIMKLMVKENRQTMNLRLMPTAKLLLVQDKDKKFLTAGWAGVDYENNQEFPETFSSFIVPNYRKIQLSLILKHALYAVLYFNNCKKAYVRIEAEKNQNLIEYYLKTGAYRILNANEINYSWKANCFKCELYNHSCKSQTYLEVDVVKIFNYCNHKLGILSDKSFPKSVVLQDISGSFFAKWKDHHDH